MSDTTGTPKKVTLDGLTFDVMADANFNQIKGKYSNEAVPTSGRNIQKKTVRPQNVESINLYANDQEADLLRVLSERSGNFPMSYETASDSVFRAVGFIDYEGHDTEKGLAVIKMTPESVDGFALFLG